jgi:hypothetical protein
MSVKYAGRNALLRSVSDRRILRPYLPKSRVIADVGKDLGRLRGITGASWRGKGPMPGPRWPSAHTPNYPASAFWLFRPKCSQRAVSMGCSWQGAGAGGSSPPERVSVDISSSQWYRTSVMQPKRKSDRCQFCCSPPPSVPSSFGFDFAPRGIKEATWGGQG